LHYVITQGGDLPNVVPPEAEVWYFIRAFHPAEMRDVLDRVRDIARGAALMTGTTMEEIFRAACSRLLSNHYLADLQYEAMGIIGPITWTDEELNYAQAINESYPTETSNGIAVSMGLSAQSQTVHEQPLIGENFPSTDEDHIMTASTDVGDLSWKTPLSMLTTACFPAGVPIHTWGAVASAGSTIGHKGMMHAAKIMALTAVDLLSEPSHLEAIRKEFDAVLDAQPYQCPIPNHIQPERFES
jgi:aminobenzoyl-glutamate utilization protein B